MVGLLAELSRWPLVRLFAMSDEIRKHPNVFSQASINEAIEGLPEDAHGAIVLYADADADKMRFGVVAKIGDQWSFAGALDREWDGPWTAHGEARFAW